MSADIQVYTGGPCACNGYLVKGPQGYVAIDAPAGFAAWVKKKLPEGSTVTDLLITHQHFDHVQGAAELAANTGCKIHACMPYSTALTLEDLARNAWGGGYDVEPYSVDNAFGSACTGATWGGLNWRIHHIPGHSPDGTAYELLGHGSVFCGDILFAGAIGRTDFPGGSLSKLVNGIREKLLSLPHTTCIYSGHGPATSIEEEVLNNPYL